MSSTDSLSHQIAQVARSLQSESGSVDTMNLAVKLAVDVIDGAEDAGISLVHRRRHVDTPAYTGERGLQVDQLQYELGEGPCLSAIWAEEWVHAADLATDTRWGEFGPRAAREMGIRSMLCLRMFTSEHRVGALNLYSTRAHAFETADVDAAVAFAAHAAIAVLVAQNDEGKDIALDSRTLIGQATGIVMERYSIDAVRAFAVLKRLSQDTNVQLHQVAAELIRTRRLD